MKYKFDIWLWQKKKGMTCASTPAIDGKAENRLDELNNKQLSDLSLPSFFMLTSSLFENFLTSFPLTIAIPSLASMIGIDWKQSFVDLIGKHCVGTLENLREGRVWAPFLGMIVQNNWLSQFILGMELWANHAVFRLNGMSSETFAAFLVGTLTIGGYLPLVVQAAITQSYPDMVVIDMANTWFSINLAILQLAHPLLLRMLPLSKPRNTTVSFFNQTGKWMLSIVARYGFVFALCDFGAGLNQQIFFTPSLRTAICGICGYLASYGWEEEKVEIEDLLKTFIQIKQEKSAEVKKKGPETFQSARPSKN
eukprot:scaffold1881_cov181-Ochromonas_danica.AAC.11